MVSKESGFSPRTALRGALLAGVVLLGPTACADGGDVRPDYIALTNVLSTVDGVSIEPVQLEGSLPVSNKTASQQLQNTGNSLERLRAATGGKLFGQLAVRAGQNHIVPKEIATYADSCAPESAQNNGGSSKDTDLAHHVRAEAGGELSMKDLLVLVVEGDPNQKCPDNIVRERAVSIPSEKVIILYDGAAPPAVVLHELNHLLGYGHDNRVDSPDSKSPNIILKAGGIVTRGANRSTTAGYNESIEKDADIFSGRELEMFGLLDPKSIWNITDPGQYGVQFQALNNPDPEGTRLLVIPIGDGPFDLSRGEDAYLYLELSGDQSTDRKQGVSLKAYVLAKGNETLNSTYLVKLGSDEAQDGMVTADIGKPVTIQTGGETITIDLQTLSSKGAAQGTAKVAVTVAD